EPLPPGRRDNLWQPVPGDPGAHGRFDAEAREDSLQYRLTTQRGAVLAGLAAVAALAWALAPRRGLRRS
ncbi:MAG TPA: short-chain dehydrogenase, partial [Ramlibacter sp.]